MIIGAPKETYAGERRVAMSPDSATHLQKLGYECIIESGAGIGAGFTDAAYEAAGVKVTKTAADVWKSADIVVKVRAVDTKEQKQLRKGQTVISFFLACPKPRSFGQLQISQGKCHCHGYGTADQPRPKDGRAFIDGEYCRISRRH
jgi:NAD/NADP transhydrogenase alpha subunit